MALANVAVHLARRGRRVLVVDFDLEAPGLDTFPALRPPAPTPGLVDYVDEYLRTDQAPDVREFVCASASVDNLLIMPSGVVREHYAAHLGWIDWGALYDEHEGYLFFEDLKAQWRQAFAPDYVLIDSRTGFTDTAGICTRQLPDALTVFFFPNEQNLRGLAKVVADVRSEAETPREKTIQLHFVMSNVPDLDDEDDILIQMKERFQQQLGFKDEPLVVHRYDSLSLLNQRVFALDRPKSRLALEYGHVADRIVEGNLTDPDGALRYIREQLQRLEKFWIGPGDSDAALEATIGQIETLHGKDGEILFGLGQLASHLNAVRAESLLARAIQAGHRRPETLLERAKVRVATGDAGGASEDARGVLDFQGVPPHIVMQAIRILSDEASPDVGVAPAITSLTEDEQVDVVQMLMRIGEDVVGPAILRSLAEDPDGSPESRWRAAAQLAIYRIGSGEFRAAMELLTHGGRGLDRMGIQDAFNFGMALWAESGAVATAPFQRVLDLHATAQGQTPSPNYLQCLAIANWAMGLPVAGIEHGRQALEEAESEALIFSCWRYRTVRRDAFMADTEAILALIDGDDSQVPRFWTRPANEDPAAADPPQTDPDEQAEA